MTKAVFKAFSAGLMFFSVGCAQLDVLSVGSPPASGPASGTESETRTVAVELVSVLGQLPGLDPFSTTAQVSPIQSEFGDSVVDALQDVGYGVQRVSTDQGTTHVSYRMTQSIENSRTVTEFEVGLRGVRVARNYAKSSNRWAPTSAIRVYGAEPVRVLVNDDLHPHSAEARRQITGVVFHDAQGNILESRDFTVLVGGGGNSDSGAIDSSTVQRSLSLGQASVFGRQRAYAIEDQRNFKTVAEVVLHFPSDNPSTLGARNKRAIAALLQRHENNTDRFVIQGCSQGATLMWDGTESLSMERQQRVNKELLVSGVSPEAIVEEGCLRRSSDTQLLKQSVRLQLAREITSQANEE